jgi:hypothetical protein
VFHKLRWSRLGVVVALCLGPLAAGCTGPTTYQNVVVPKEDRDLRWGEPVNGLRAGILVEQEQFSSDSAWRWCSFQIYLQPVHPRVDYRVGPHAHGQAGQAQSDTVIVLPAFSLNSRASNRVVEVKLTFPDGTTHTIPQTLDKENEIGLCNYPGNSWMEVFSLDDFAESFPSPSTAVLVVTYRMEPKGDDPSRWSGTVTTPPVRVRFERVQE